MTEKVVGVDTARRELTVEAADGARRVITVPTAKAVLLNGLDAALEQLRPGDEILDRHGAIQADRGGHGNY